MGEIGFAQDVAVSIRILEGENKGKYKTILCSAAELIQEGLPAILIDQGVFECMGHPCNHYQLERIFVAP